MKKILEEATNEKDSIQNKINQCIDLSLNDLLVSQIHLPKQLCGDLIFDNELVILFGSTGLGKTILSFQIADWVSKGISNEPFQNEIGEMKVLYINLEMSNAQIKKRCYNENLGNCQFSNNFRIITRVIYENEFELSRLIEEKIIEHNPGFVVIDNISFIVAKREESESVKLLMKNLNELKTKYNLSILAVGHTPKVSTNFELELRHLAGSSNLSNFADGVFALGKSCKSPETKYLKMLKNRGSSGNEMVFELNLISETNFLHFDFVGMNYESEHLKKYMGDELESEIMEFKKKGDSIGNIANKLGKSKGAIQYYIDKQKKQLES